MNAPATTMPSPETAPRTPEELTKMTVFLQRRLAEQLNSSGFPVWTSEPEKTAFITETSEKRGMILAEKLAAFDKARGGAPAAAAPVATVTPITPPTEATPAPATASKRQPKTQAAAPPPAAAPAVSGEQGVLSSEVVNLLKTVSTDLKNLHGMTDARIEGVENRLDGGKLVTKGDLVELKDMLTASMRVQQATLGVLCLFGQEVLKASTRDVMGPAIEEANNALDALEELGKGKALARRGPGRAASRCLLLMSSISLTTLPRSRPMSLYEHLPLAACVSRARSRGSS